MRATDQRLTALTRHWARLLGLDRWTLTFHFGPFADNDGKVGSTTAACVAYPEYEAAELYYDVARINALEDDLDGLVRHELFHCHLAALVGVADKWAGDDAGRQEFVRQLNERTTTHLERMAVFGRH